MITILKKIFRRLYYYFNNGKVVRIEGYDHLQGSQWIFDKRFGMAYFKGAYEPKMCNYLLKNLHEDNSFVDVGAHAGYFSLFAAKLVNKGKVFSFEPDPINFSFINKIKNLNGVDNWKVHNMALGNQTGKLFFSEGSTSSTGRIEERGKLEVQVSTLDQVLRDEESIDLIKIDVEGFGGRVLEGGTAIIKKHKPKILMEIHEGSDEFNTILNMLGFSYNLFDFETGLKVSKGSSPHFVIAEPKN